MKEENDLDGKREWQYCVVGNIVKTRINENGVLRYGTSAFTGGTKAYICGKYWNEKQKAITVIGLSRRKKYTVSDIPLNTIENVRCQRVYKPKILELMSDSEFWDYWWETQKKKKNQPSGLLKIGTRCSVKIHQPNLFYYFMIKKERELWKN